MKIALAHDFLLRLGGAEKVLNIFSEIYPDAKIYTLIFDKRKFSNFKEKEIRTSFLQKIPFSHKFHRALLPLMPTALENFDFSEFDIVLSSSTALMHGIITNTNTRHICYTHSPARYLWDYSHQYVEERGKFFLDKFLMKKVIRNLRKWDAASGDRPDKILANSINVQERIEKYWRAKSEVVYPFVDLNEFKISESNEDYFLIISFLSSFKKIDLAISLFNKIGKKLVIVGDGPQRKYLEKISSENIDFLGRVSEKTKNALLENCRALVFPGEEDFGIVPIEANACGKPVLAYKKGGLLETQEEGVTCEFFEDQNIDSMENALGKILRKEKNFDRKAIRKNAERFSKEKFMKNIKRIVDKEYSLIR